MERRQADRGGRAPDLIISITRINTPSHRKRRSEKEKRIETEREKERKKHREKQRGRERG